MKKRLGKNKIPIWIVDDNENYCILLSESLRPNKKIHVEKSFHSVKEVLRRLQRNSGRPSVILLDIRMPEIDGIEGIAKILRWTPETKILMLTSHDDEEEIQEALKNGAAGYLLKSSTAIDISRAVEKVTEGGSPIDPMIARKIVGMLMNNNHISNDALKLTKREKEMIKLIVKGMSNDKIAAVMNISYYTTTTHLKNIYKKLHVHSRHTLVAKAFKEGIVLRK